MNAVAKTIRPKRPRRPIYFTVARVVVLETGEEVGALVPDSGWDRKAMRDRKYSVGTRVRAELKKPRNPMFMRLVHALGTMMVEQVEDFAGTDQHEAIKRLQRESGACCEGLELDLGTLGTHTVNVARSIAFDEMDDGEFSELFRALCRHVSTKYWPTMDEDQIARQAELMRDTGP